jgi:hypothetical protein
LPRVLRSNSAKSCRSGSASARLPFVVSARN